MQRSRETHWKLKFTVLTLIIVSSLVSAEYLKVTPPPDVDKSAHHSDPLPPTCWLATAANMLAGAGYGNGSTLQERADDIYEDLTSHYGTGSGGWTDTALTWWLNSENNKWESNPYDVVTVYGNKTRTPWTNSDGAQFIGNELRRCQMLGLSISWPRTSAGGSSYGGHAITCWGDSGDKTELTSNPEKTIVADSDRDNGGDLQIYTYDDYTDPNPDGEDEGNGWYFNYSNNHPFLKHIVTLCPTDNPGDHTQTQKVVGSYRIHQNNMQQPATDLHYKVGTDVDILSYNTTIDWETAEGPDIKEDANPPRELTVDWYMEDNPVPYCNWVTITTEFVVPYWNAISYRDVFFTYNGEPGYILPPFRWEIITPRLEIPEKIPNITGGYVVGAFELYSYPQESPEIIGEYRFLHEYDYMQNPEFHSFRLAGIGQLPQGYYAGNFRFGHSYGMLNTDELFEFNDWMTRIPQAQPLDPEKPVELALDWQGSLPYPQGENYLGEFKPPECTEYLPADLNKDCCVNFRDLAIFAEDWLECTTTNREEIPWK